MKRKKAAEPEVVEGFVTRNMEEPEPAGGGTRMTIVTTEDGGIDWDKSKNGTPDELLSAITNDPTMLEKIATCPDFQEAGGDGTLVTNDEAGLVLDVLTSVEGLVFSSISKKVLGMKIDQSIISENFQLTEKDHERQDPLAAHGLNMLQEYLQLDPKWRWIIFLATAHGASVLRNVKVCANAQFKKDEMTPENPATPGKLQ